MNARAVGIAAALGVLAGPVPAQQLRFRSTTSVQYVQMRPIHFDQADSTYVVDPVAYAAPVVQDLEISAWGLGVQGLRGYALLRGRGALGSELVWPRSTDHFDALYGYLELERPTWRLRGGRQQRFSGLGFYAFDGLTATARPYPTVRVEAYGGRGLARGFLEPVNSPQIRSPDPLRPERGTILVGASLWAAPAQAASFTVIYQREILSDRSGIASERAALDAQAMISRRLYATASADADLAASAWGRMRASLVWRMPRRGYLEVEAFRYRPVFDLTTIWGVFSPEGHNGAGATLNLAPAASLGVSAGITYRHYTTPASASPFLQHVGDNVTQASAGLRWRRGKLAVDGAYRLTTGFGGKQSGGDAMVALAPPDAWRLAVKGTAFQQVQDFRVAGGTVYGAGVEARGRLLRRAALRLELSRYWHVRGSGTTGADWSQTRGLMSLDWTFGANADRRPGARP